jgi:type II restriction/modification system DNA methylase subunit YeeA
MVPDNLVIAIARDDDVWLGLCQTCFHEIWSVRQAFFIGVGNDPTYTPTSTFETFPFPEGLTPNVSTEGYSGDPKASRIALLSANLNELREKWLNPSDLVKHVPEVVSGYPDRIRPKTEASAEQLKKRTLTNLYNERPTWLAHAHRDLDRAVAAAYGWPETLADRAQPENPDAADRKAAEEEILKRLFDLNQERAKAGR